jgi:lysozyme family protein
MSGENSDIIVEGWSLRYAAAAARLRRTEGGFVDDKADHGGATNLGWSLRSLVAEGKIDLDADGFADFDLDMDGDIDVADIRALTWGDAKFLYHRCFWQRLDADSFAGPIGEMLFDQGVNGGLVAAKKMLQRAINLCIARFKMNRAPLDDDGAVGPVTRAALDAVLRVGSMAALVEAYRAVVKVRYLAIVAADPTQKRFLNGWLARADQLGKLA